MSRNCCFAFLLFTALLSAVAASQMPEVGKAAPAFKAKNQASESITFPVAGKWSVLAFYPRASSPG